MLKKNCIGAYSTGSSESIGSIGPSRSCTDDEKWCEQKLLGLGSFGQVYLYKNLDSGVELAVKSLILQSSPADEDGRINHWKEECERMLILKHPNIVEVFDVPLGICRIANSNLPLMAMEYCWLGDLRKVLLKPENCLGLSQLDVRSVIHDMSAAIEYIHSKDIVHRDIKPENILLSSSDKTLGGKVVYKLCDLGLGKDLTGGLLCEKWVGTRIYMAPEIINDKKYDKRVDYWSFGVLIYECISGKHPFLHQKRYTKEDFKNAILDIGKKQSTHICHQRAFSPFLPETNRLHSLLQKYLEQWLRLMLECDPMKRGGKIDEETGRLTCFSHLEEIMKLQFVNFFSPLSNEMNSCPVFEGSATLGMDRKIQDLLKMSRSSTGNYTLLSSSGVMIQSTELVSSYAAPYYESEDESMIYLLDPGESICTNLCLSTMPDNLHPNEWCEKAIQLLIDDFNKSSRTIRHLVKFQQAISLWSKQEIDQLVSIEEKSTRSLRDAAESDSSSNILSTIDDQHLSCKRNLECIKSLKSSYLLISSNNQGCTELLNFEDIKHKINALYEDVEKKKKDVKLDVIAWSKIKSDCREEIGRCLSWLSTRWRTTMQLVRSSMQCMFNNEWEEALLSNINRTANSVQRKQLDEMC